MSAGRREMFAAALREDPVDLGLACTLLAAEADPLVVVSDVLAHLDAFAALARPLVEAAPPEPVGWTEALRVALGEQAGFAGGAEDYGQIASSLLPEVLRRRRGLPILLTVVWSEVARRLGVPAYPVTLPGHVLLGVGAGEAAVYADPFAGGLRRSVHEVAEQVRAAGAAFTRDLLRPAPPAAVVLRVLTNIRVLAARTGDARTRLWAVELSLLVPGHPAALRHERAETLVRLGDFLGGAAEWEGYAEIIAADQPAAAEAARHSARAARARLC